MFQHLEKKLKLIYCNDSGIEFAQNKMLVA
jgi:hypothetical protein